VADAGDFQVIGKSDITAMLGFEKERMLLACAEESSCVAEIGGALGVDKIVVGNVGRVEETYLLSIKVIDIRKARVEARISEVVEGKAAPLIATIRRRVPDLLAKVRPAEPAPPPAASAPAPAAAPSSPPVAAPAPVAVPAAVPAPIAAAVPAPPAAPGAAPVPAPAAAQTPATALPSGAVSAGPSPLAVTGWVALGVGAASGAAAGFFAWRSNVELDRYRSAIEPDEIRDARGSVENAVGAATATVVLAGASAALGAVLVLISH
jgi:hypothetical protein